MGVSTRDAGTLPVVWCRRLRIPFPRNKVIACGDESATHQLLKLCFRPSKQVRGIADMKISCSYALCIAASYALAATSACAADDISRLPSAVQLMVTAGKAATEADEGTLYAIKGSPGRPGASPANRLLAEALLQRMHFHYAATDGLAAECMQTARQVGDFFAELQCGWVRISLARLQLDLSGMAARAGEIQGALKEFNEWLKRTAGPFDPDPETSFFLSAGKFSSLRHLPPASMDDLASTPTTVPLTYQRNQLFGHIPRMVVKINGVPVEFSLDTGSYFSTIPVALADYLGLHRTNFRVPTTDVSGATHLYATGVVDKLSIGDVVVRHFPILLDDDKDNIIARTSNRQMPMIGADLLLFLKHYQLSRNQLVLFPKADPECNSVALLSASMDSGMAGVFNNADTNYGTLRTLLDIGSNMFASASLAHGRAYDVEHMPSSSFPMVLVGSDGGLPDWSAYLPLIINAKGGSLLNRIALQQKMPEDAQLRLGAPSLLELSYYFDLSKGVACMTSALAESDKKEPTE